MLNQGLNRVKTDEDAKLLRNFEDRKLVLWAPDKPVIQSFKVV